MLTILFQTCLPVKQKQITDFSLFTTMYGIPQNSHLGAAVWWEERKLRKSCNRSRNEETVFVPTVRRSRVQEASIKPSWYWTHTHTHSLARTYQDCDSGLDQNTSALCIRTAGCWDGRVGNGGQRDRRGCGLHPGRLHRTPRCQKLAGAEGYVIFREG